MFKKRQTTKLQKKKHLRESNEEEDRLKEVKSEEPLTILHGSESKSSDHGIVNNNEEISEESKRIQAAKEVHRLRQRVKGLAAIDDTLIIGCRGRHHSNNPIDQSLKFDLLDKVFQQQGEKYEAKVDKNLEEYLSSRLSSEFQGVVDDAVEKEKCETRRPEIELENSLYEIPTHLQVKDIAQEGKDKISWITGLMEVPISIESKLKTIEETEMAKRRLLRLERDEDTNNREELFGRKRVKSNRNF